MSDTHDAPVEPTPTPEEAAVVEPIKETTLERLYAFWLPRPGNGTARVTDYENTHEGQLALANLIRGENVIQVVLGRGVEVSKSSVVDMKIDAATITHKVTYG